MNNLRNLDLSALVLQVGAHTSPSDGMCIMEAAAYLAGQPHSDSPPCVMPAIGSFLRSWNDTGGNEIRQQIRRYVPLILGTAGTAAQNERCGFLALDWQIRTALPVWMALAKLDTGSLGSLPPIMDMPSATLAAPIVRAARAAAGAAARAAAWDAAGAAAGAAARAAAWDAAGAAARAAAWDAAGDAARAAAWAAARAAAWAAAWDAAGDAARDAAGDAAWDAAGAAAGAAAGDAAGAAAWDAAGVAAGALLAPTRDTLVASAHDLVVSMIQTTKPEISLPMAAMSLGIDASVLRHAVGDTIQGRKESPRTIMIPLHEVERYRREVARNPL
jgi:hypothetical protein